MMSWSLGQKCAVINFQALTWRLQIERDCEAHYGQDSQVHDAGDTKEEPYQSIIYTGSISPNPAVAPSRGHRQRVHCNRRSQVSHSQIHTKQLWGLHLWWPFDCRDDDQKVSNDGENPWNTERVNTNVSKSLEPLKNALSHSMCGVLFLYDNQFILESMCSLLKHRLLLIDYFHSTASFCNPYWMCMN